MNPVGNIYSPVATNSDGETFEILLQTDDFRLERIVSEGHATPAGEWFDQAQDEWVILLQGSAGLSIDGTADPIVLNPGDYLLISARQKHRVEWTSASEKTYWLAVHFNYRTALNNGVDP
ncbi:MAG: cupin domain-containing protein [Gammaproteobacteria bacterium]